MIMEMGGVQLFDVLVDKQRLSCEEVNQIASQLINAMDYLHSHQICHRDIKAENILCQGKLIFNLLVFNDVVVNVKLVDFGIAKFFKQSPMHSPRTGTLGYKAPELFHTGFYTEAVDMWSIGVVLYICLCGLPPFRSREFELLDLDDHSAKRMRQAPFWIYFNEQDDWLINSIKHDPIVFPKDIEAPLLKELILAMLEKDPSIRMTAKEAKERI